MGFQIEIGLLLEAAFKTVLKKSELTNLCRISDNLFKSCIFADFCRCRAEIYLKPWTIFAKATSKMYDWDLNTSLEDFVQDAPKK